MKSDNLTSPDVLMSKSTSLTSLFLIWTAKKTLLITVPSEHSFPRAKFFRQFLLISNSFIPRQISFRARNWKKFENKLEFCMNWFIIFFSELCSQNLHTCVVNAKINSEHFIVASRFENIFHCRFSFTANEFFFSNVINLDF